jgi:hypothetical protein
MMAAVLVSSVLVAFVPTAAAGITNFEIAPDTGEGCEVAAYMAELTTDAEFTTLNIILPAGFGAQAPTIGGVLIARVDLWNDTLYYGFVTFRANNADPSHKLDVHADIGGDTADATIDVDYRPGETTNVGSPFGGASHATLILPTDLADGGVEVSLPMGMKDVVVDIERFVKNPTMCGGYNFDITVNGDTDSATVQIVGGKPDLVITDIRIEDGRIWYTIKNEGCARAGRSYTGLWIDGVFEARDRVGRLASGESSIESFRHKWACTPPEDTIKVCADYRGRIEECDEENNCKEQIEICPKPDLVISEKWEQERRGKYKVYFVVENIGAATAPGGHHATLSVDGVEIEHKRIRRDLKPGKTYRSSFRTRVVCTGDFDTIKVCADDFDDVDESNELNNCRENVWICGG